jgi:hypothetical protein
MAVSHQRLGKHVPAEKTRTQQYSYNGNGGVFYVVRAEELKRRQLGQSSSVESCQLSVESSSAMEAKKR